MEDKIIQLLQAPRTLYASTFDDDGNNQRDLRVVCLALLESGTVRPMVIVGGELTLADRPYFQSGKLRPWQD